MMVSPFVWYIEQRKAGKTDAQISSFCRQVASMADLNERKANEAAEQQKKSLLDKRTAERPQEPWEDAPGVLLG